MLTNVTPNSMTEISVFFPKKFCYNALIWREQRTRLWKITSFLTPERKREQVNLFKN